MKKCPHCSAQIEDNARFCLYCMTSLEHKTIIESIKSNNKGWQVSLAALLVFVILVVSLFAMGTKKPAPSTSSGFSQSETSSLDEAENGFVQSEGGQSLQGPSQNGQGSDLASSDNGSSRPRPNHVGGESSETATSQNQNTVTSVGSVSSSVSSPNSNTTSSTSSNAVLTPNKPSNSSAAQSPVSSSPTVSASSKPSAAVSSKTSTSSSTTDNDVPKEVSSGKEGIYSYTLYSNNEVTITDTDESLSGHIIVPSTLGGHTVTIIGLSAFNGQKEITRVTLPDSIKVIGQYAFYGCVKLESINIPNDAIYILHGAFNSCHSLKSFTFPKGIKIISSRMFVKCFALTDVTIPSSVTDIEESAFLHCTNLKNVWYEGSPTQKNNIVINNNYSANDPVLNATWHYNYSY